MTKKAVKLAHEWLENADAILVTASNGFSISEGYNLFANDKKLREVIGEDIVEKYHLPNLIMAGNFQYPSPVEHWRVLARIGEYYFNNYEESPYMSDLKEIIGNKPTSFGHQTLSTTLILRVYTTLWKLKEILLKPSVASIPMSTASFH
ncbi:hypothetical protein [Lactobacillus hamsteri]|uniref:hypothetical protein n=1 Tax=Lactobacillus hamsteri TaxID=96565 RepID=UPI000B232A50|nr:hypothetical protein [Lactobacillus hamsteri]